MSQPGLSSGNSRRPRRVLSLGLAGAGVAQALVIVLVLQSAEEESTSMREFGVVSGRALAVTTTRRAVRNTQLAMLERELSPSPERETRGQAVGRDAAQILSTAEALRATARPGDDAALTGELLAAIHDWERELRATLAAARVSPEQVASLRQALDRIDGLTARLIDVNTRAGQEASVRASAADTRRWIALVLSTMAIMLALVFALWWWLERQRLAAEVAASEESGRQLQRMAAGVAHEINNQVGALQNTVDLLQRKLPGDELIGYQRDSLEQLEKLTHDFSDFSHAGARSLESFDVVDLTRLVAGPFGEQVEVRASGPLPVHADRARLKSALLNMMKNAVEAGAPVQVEVGPSDVDVVIRCIDHGAGVAPQHAASIGQPFFTTKARGTGLGVALVQEVARAHGGSFSLLNHPPHGAVAELRLPMRPAPG